MAIGNLEAIRDWMEDAWYNKDNVDIIFTSIGNGYRLNSKYYIKQQGVFIDPTGDMRYPYIKMNTGSAYRASYHLPNSSYGHPLLVSLKEENVSYYNTSSYSRGAIATSEGSIMYNGQRWYYASNDLYIGLSYDAPNITLGWVDTKEDAVLKLLQNIYA